MGGAGGAVSAYTRTYINTYIHTFAHVCVYVYMYVYIYGEIEKCVCTYIYIYLYISVHLSLSSSSFPGYLIQRQFQKDKKRRNQPPVCVKLWPRAYSSTSDTDNS